MIEFAKDRAYFLYRGRAEEAKESSHVTVCCPLSVQEVQIFCFLTFKHGKY